VTVGRRSGTGLTAPGWDAVIGPAPGQGREIFTITLFITLRRIQISQIYMRHNQYRPPEQAAQNGGYLKPLANRAW
jgi:hypothetical protein